MLCQKDDTSSKIIDKKKIVALTKRITAVDVLLKPVLSVVHSAKMSKKKTIWNLEVPSKFRVAFPIAVGKTCALCVLELEMSSNHVELTCVRRLY